MFIENKPYFYQPKWTSSHYTLLDQIESVFDFLIGQQMKDGGFNCHSNRKGVVHSSQHATLSVLEGIQEYTRNGYSYRLPELQQMAGESVEFILLIS